MRDFIDNIDWGKNLIFLIVYVSIVVLCIFTYLVPIMDNYKSAIMEYRKTNILDNQIATTLERLKENEANLVRENSDIFTRLKRKMSTKEVQSFARTHIKGANVKDLGITEDENGIKIHSFKITGQTRSLSSVKSLISAVSALESSVKIAFPIIISKKTGQKTLGIEISLMVFNAKREISAENSTELNMDSSESSAENSIDSNKSIESSIESNPESPTKSPAPKSPNATK